MSAIEEILEKETHTLLERCVVSVWFEGNSLDEEIATKAAQELLNIRSKLNVAVSALEKISDGTGGVYKEQVRQYKDIAQSALERIND
jgi:hypothetical protein